MEKPSSGSGQSSEIRPFKIRIPGFITDEEIGLGDCIKRITYAIGIKPCSPCEQRAAALNRRVVFAPRTKYWHANTT